jgi:hypothetical protein
MRHISIAATTRCFITRWKPVEERTNHGKQIKNKPTWLVAYKICTRFCKVDPMRFRVGDIAKVQITVVAVPIRHEKYKMLVQLRSIALLDGRFTDVRTHPEFKKYYADVTKTNVMHAYQFQSWQITKQNPTEFQRTRSTLQPNAFGGVEVTGQRGIRLTCQMQIKSCRVEDAKGAMKARIMPNTFDTAAERVRRGWSGNNTKTNTDYTERIRRGWSGRKLVTKGWSGRMRLQRS